MLEACTVYGRAGNASFMKSTKHAWRRSSILSSCFLVSESNKSIKIQHPMKLQYSSACVSLQQVYKWSMKFKNGVCIVTDVTWPGQAHTCNKAGNCRGWTHQQGKPSHWTSVTVYPTISCLTCWSYMKCLQRESLRNWLQERCMHTCQELLR